MTEKIREETTDFPEGVLSRPIDPASLQTIHSLFFKTAAEQPDSIAIESRGEAIAFSQISARAGRLANALVDSGLEPGQRVALLFDSGPSLIEAMFATLACGAVMVALDPSYPDARLAAILDESEPAIVLGDLQNGRERNSLFEGRGLRRLLVDSNGVSSPTDGWETFDPTDLREFSTTPPPISVEPSAPCYIAYTSGSTGRPKGILQSHGGFTQFISWQSQELRIGPGDRWAQWASIAYDASYCEIFGALCFGATLLLEEPVIRYDPEALVGWVTDKAATILQVVPSFSREIVGILESTDGRTSLRTLMLAGERLHLDLAQRWMTVLGEDRSLYNLYGPSESVLATFHRVVAEDMDRASIPIGRPIYGREILLLDREGLPVRTGDPGELYIRSAYLALGYFKNDEETRRRFIQNPLHGDYPDPVYRSGDMARMLPDGLLEFIGREDRLVKLRGVRVELGDIEARARSFDGIEEAVAVVRAIDPSNKKLISKEREARDVEDDPRQVLALFFTATVGVDTRALRRYLEAYLPIHMVPQSLRQLDAMPRNVNQKIDEGALPEIDLTTARRGGHFIEPRTEAERTVASIWQEVLKVGEVGAGDDFFELGGDSILAMRVLSRLREETGTSLTFRDLFANQTVERLALGLAGMSTQGGAGLERVEYVDEPGPVPLSLAQLGIWFLWRLEPDNPYYTAQGSIRLRGPINLVALRTAWSRLIQRHEILRSRFALDEGRPIQTFRNDRPDDLSVIDLSGFPEDGRETEMRRRSRLKVRPLDLESDPLFEAELFRFGAEEHEIAITFHEIILDLWGLSLIMTDLKALYLGTLAGDELTEVMPPLRFQDYVRWEDRNLTRKSLEAQISYWADHLAGELPVLALPLDHPRPAKPSYRGAAQSVFLNAELSASLRQISREHHTTLFMTLLSAFYVLLGEYAQQNELVVGAPIANRSHAHSEEIVGFFLNMLPLRVTLEDDMTFSALLDRVAGVVSGGISNADCPLPWILESADIARDRGTSPAFQVMFNMLNLPDEAIDMQDLEVTFDELDSGYVKYDLSLYAQEHGDRIFLQLAYMEDLFEPETVSRMLRNLELFLSEAVIRPGASLGEIPKIAESERLFLVEDFNRTEEDYRISKPISQLFEEVVVSRPNDPAFLFGTATISYRELNEASNRIANSLISAGVEFGAPVAICVDRGFNVPKASLAILKAGGAYVALDPEYPLPRLEEILDDAGCRAMIVSPHLDRFSGFDGIKVDPDDEGLEAFAASNPQLGDADDPILAVVYTSSSTGHPKGVAIGQSAVLNRLAWMWTEYPFQEGDVAVMQKSNALVAATWELFGGLLKGVPTLLLDMNQVRDPSLLWEACVENCVSYFLGVPALLEGILLEAETREDPWSSLRMATTSAEPISPAMARRWARLFPNVPLLNLYGATECCSNALSYDSTESPQDRARVPVGTPIGNVQAYLLDDSLRPVPWGAPGELCIGGACLAHGYVGAASSEMGRFVDNPFGHGGRLYRTGDRARLRHDGVIELLGRADLQVKIRGFRVELNDVENALQEHPDVERCAAFLDDQVTARPRLVALVEAKQTDGNALRDFLVGRLPSYMVPAQVAIVDELPLTPNGKINRAQLQAPDADRSDASSYIAPKDSVERELAAIWEDLLSVSPVGVNDNFFELGGHSLLAVRMMDRIGRVLGHSLPIALLFQTPTIDALAKHLQQAEQSTSGSVSWETVVPIQTEGDRPPIFFVHDGAGGVFHFNYLARALGDDQPFYGLQPQAWDYSRAESPTIPGLAEHYVAAIRSVQPAGPYLIGGFCFGGIVALEIAQQLRAKGIDVGILALVEPSRVRNRLAPPHLLEGAKAGSQIDRNRMRKFAAKVKRKLVHKQGAELIDPAKVGTYRSPAEIAELTAIVIARSTKRAICQGFRTIGRPIPRRLRNFYFKDQVSRKAGVRYEAKPYDGEIDIFLARRHGLDWQGLARGGTAIHRIPADESGYVPDHLTMLHDPWISYVADPLRVAIDSAIAKNAGHDH